MFPGLSMRQGDIVFHSYYVFGKSQPKVKIFINMSFVFTFATKAHL